MLKTQNQRLREGGKKKKKPNKEMDGLQTERENLVRMSKIQRAERDGGAKRGRERAETCMGFFPKSFRV